jgi:hypothetical protein
MNNRAEARRQGLAIGHYRTQLLLQALQRNIGTITAAKSGVDESTLSVIDTTIGTKECTFSANEQQKVH